MCEANRLKYKGNWKLAYDNSCDGYHVVFSHRSLLEMENRFADEAQQGHVLLSRLARQSADVHALHRQRQSLQGQAAERRAACGWPMGDGVGAPGMEHYEEKFKQRYGARADALLDLAGSEPVNINVFPNFSLLGNHIQVFEPVSVNETNAVWYGTRIVDADGDIGEDAVADINALRMRTQEGFPNFGEVDDVANFEEIQRGLDALGRRVGLHAPRPRHPGPHQASSRRHHHGAGDRRSVHARELQGMEAADAGAAEPCNPEGAVMALPAQDPSRSSYYISDDFYRDLIANFTDWQRDENAVADPAERERFRMLLEREARLLDQLRYEDWLTLYAPECVYWVPATPNAGDPRREVAVMFDDRRRLEDRVYRLRTGFAWSQAPASRTVRLISNVEVFATGDDTVRMVRSNFLISEFWGDEIRLLSGWTGHRCVAQDGRWLIQAKQVNLLECDQSIRNPSIVL